MNFREKYKTDGAFKKKVNKLGIFSIVIFFIVLLVYLTEFRKSNSEEPKLSNVIPENYVDPVTVDIIEDKTVYYNDRLSNDSINLIIPGDHNKNQSTENPVEDYIKNRETQRRSIPPVQRRTPVVSTPNRRVVDADNFSSNEVVTQNPTRENKIVDINPEPVLSAKELKRQELRERKQRLETGSSSLDDTKNFNVAVNGTQTVKNGQTVALRVLNDAMVSGRELKKNTLVYGTVKFGEYRVMVDVKSVRIGNEIVPVNMAIYGMDGQQGIPISANDILQPTKDRAQSEAKREVQRTGIPGARVLSEVFSKNRDVEVKLINNHRLILLNN